MKSPLEDDHEVSKELKEDVATNSGEATPNKEDMQDILEEDLDDLEYVPYKKDKKGKRTKSSSTTPSSKK